MNHLSQALWALDFDAASGEFRFEPDVAGTYIFEFTAVDREGNPASTTLEVKTLLPGDITGRGCVDFGDLSYLAAYFGKPNMPTEPLYPWKNGDFDGNYKIDFGDLSYMAAYFGDGDCPEPKQ